MRNINEDHTPFPWHCVNYAGYIRIQDKPFYDGLDIFDEEKIGEHTAAANVKIIESLPEILEENITLKSQRDELLKALEILVHLKNIKDMSGKTYYYLEQQPKAWEQAKKAIENTTK